MSQSASSYLCSIPLRTKDVNCSGLVLRKGDVFVQGIVHMCNNPNDWIKPGKFTPEQFDSKSPFSLTPSGKKRNKFSLLLSLQAIALASEFHSYKCKQSFTTEIAPPYEV